MIYNTKRPAFRMKSPVNKPYCSQNYDNVNFELLKKLEPGLKEVLNLCPLKNTRKRILVKTRTETIRAGRCSCLPGWHLDAPLNPVHKRGYNIYHMFIIGPTTAFLNEARVIYNYNYDQRLSKFSIEDDAEEYNLVEGCWNTYGEHDWHRGIVVKDTTPRLLIRVTETNYIKENINYARSVSR